MWLVLMILVMLYLGTGIIKNLIEIYKFMRNKED